MSLRTAKISLKITKELIAAKKVSLDEVAEIVRQHRGSLFGCDRDLKDLCGRNNVTSVDMMSAMGYKIDKRATEKGRDIIIISKKACAPDSGDIVVGDLVIGYM